MSWSNCKQMFHHTYDQDSVYHLGYTIQCTVHIQIIQECEDNKFILVSSNIFVSLIHNNYLQICVMEYLRPCRL